LSDALAVFIGGGVVAWKMGLHSEEPNRNYVKKETGEGDVISFKEDATPIQFTTQDGEKFAVELHGRSTAVSLLSMAKATMRRRLEERSGAALAALAVTSWTSTAVQVVVRLVVN